MAPSQGASRSTTCISALPFSSHTPHGALSPRNRPGPAAPSPQGPCGAPDAALPSQPPPLQAGAQAARATAAAGVRGGRSCPWQLVAEPAAASPLLPLLQGCPSLPRAPPAAPELHGGASAGEPQGEEGELCRSRYSYISLLYRKSHPLREEKKSPGGDSATR